MSNSLNIKTGDIHATGANSSVTLTQTIDQTSGTLSPAVHEALAALAELKQKVTTSQKLDNIDRPSIEAAIQVTDEQLKTAKPDRGLVEKAVGRIQQVLAGVESLAPAAVRVAELIAKSWAP